MTNKTTLTAMNRYQAIVDVCCPGNVTIMSVEETENGKKVVIWIKEIKRLNYHDMQLALFREIRKYIIIKVIKE
jgi:hypothetical protein